MGEIGDTYGLDLGKKKVIYWGDWGWDDDINFGNFASNILEKEGILCLGIVVFVNHEIEKNKKPENNPQKSPNDDNPEPNNPPIDTENWWLTDEEIEHAYRKIGKEIANSPEIQLVDPSVVRVIQAGGEISEDFKKGKYIFFPINNSEQHETGDTGSHWSLLVFAGDESGMFFNYNSLEFSTTPENAMKVAQNFHKKANLATLISVENVREIPRQTNNADCGVYVIAYTRALIKKYQERQPVEEGSFSINLDKKDLIFSIDEERQKLKVAGFPKKGTSGKDYEIGDDIEYLEKEEELISH
ncbi:1269_t:CDS:2 [Funneliformis geosporum]|uniref:11190_t:CDS:1 n=1 Tax=Funneliformis geosporum TaxID=1117311 RepID=A0A9W4T087_9GLOM|nr:1269_t:CDS:2 [Funneliformis geosporum]CAI2189955.1 11190_t:CDS:2 [Funneliformis geosporum]